MAGILAQLRDTLTFENAAGAIAGGVAGSIAIPVFMDGFQGGGITLPVFGEIATLTAWQMGALIGAGAKLLVDQFNYVVLQKGEAGQLDQLDSLLAHTVGTAVAFVVVPMLLKGGATPSPAAIQKLIPAGMVSGVVAQSLSEKLAAIA